MFLGGKSCSVYPLVQKRPKSSTSRQIKGGSNVENRGILGGGGVGGGGGGGVFGRAA